MIIPWCSILVPFINSLPFACLQWSHLIPSFCLLAAFGDSQRFLLPFLSFSFFYCFQIAGETKWSWIWASKQMSPVNGNLLEFLNDVPTIMFERFDSNFVFFSPLNSGIIIFILLIGLVAICFIYNDSLAALMYNGYMISFAVIIFFLMLFAFFISYKISENSSNKYLSTIIPTTMVAAQQQQQSHHPGQGQSHNLTTRLVPPPQQGQAQGPNSGVNTSNGQNASQAASRHHPPQQPYPPTSTTTAASGGGGGGGVCPPHPGGGPGGMHGPGGGGNPCPVPGCNYGKVMS